MQLPCHPYVAAIFQRLESASLPPAHYLRRVVPLLLFAALAHAQQPQKEPPVASSTSNETSEVPQVPGISGLLRGFNGGLTISGLHDAQTGWATIAQPAIGYSFNDIFSIDITAPIYMYRLAGTRDPHPRPNALLVTQRAEPGDVTFSVHAQFIPKGFGYQATVSGTAPTGDPLYGLSTGRATFDFSNHFERAFKYVSPYVELGVGDSSSLVNPLVTRDFTSLGPLAHFQAGFAFPLPLGLSFSTNAYEQLPIGDQKIYQTITRRNAPPGTPGVTVVTGRSVSEDNGFTNSLDVPLDGHTTLSAYYNRSLRLKDDVVAIGITYVLRSFKSAKQKAADDERRLRSIQQEIHNNPPASPDPTQP